MSISIQAESDAANRAIELQEAEKGIRFLSDTDKAEDELLNVNSKNLLQNFQEPDDGFMAKLFGGDNYHPLYNHNKSEICYYMATYPKNLDKIKNIITNLPVVKLNIHCRWIAIMVVIILILIIIVYIKNDNLDGYFTKFLIGFGSILIIVGLLYKFIGGSLAEKRGFVEWQEFFNEYNSLKQYKGYEKCKYFKENDYKDEQNRLLSQQIRQSNNNSGFGQGFGIGAGYGFFNILGNIFSNK